MHSMTTATRYNAAPAGEVRGWAGGRDRLRIALPSPRRLLLGLGAVALAPILAAAVSVLFGITVAGASPAPYAIGVALIGLIGLIGANQTFDNRTATAARAITPTVIAAPARTATQPAADLNDMSARLARMEQANADLLKMLNEVTAHRDTLEYEMTIDPLTGVHNRRGLETAFDALGAGTVFAMLDLDHFKKVNDTLGHDVGDRVLKDFARLLVERLGDSLPVYRIGGEEFIVLFPKGSMGRITDLLDGFRRDLQTNAFTRITDPVTISFSAGLALRTDAAQDFDEMFKLADARLYAAKTAGRARTVSA